MFREMLIKDQEINYYYYYYYYYYDDDDEVFIVGQGAQT